MITNAAAKKLVKFVLLAMFIQLCVVGYVFYQSYSGRKNVVTFQRSDCEGRKKSIQASINVDTAILQAFYDTDNRNPDPLSPDRIAAELTIQNAIPDLKARLGLDCNKAFPLEGLLP